NMSINNNLQNKTSIINNYNDKINCIKSKYKLNSTYNNKDFLTDLNDKYNNKLSSLKILQDKYSNINMYRSNTAPPPPSNNLQILSHLNNSTKLIHDDNNLNKTKTNS